MNAMCQRRLNECWTYLTRHTESETPIGLLARNTQRSDREVDIIEGDARSVITRCVTGSAQLIVTSPPYFGVADYVKAQRLRFRVGRNAD